MNEKSTIIKKDWLISVLGLAFLLEYGILGLLKGLEGAALGWVLFASVLVLIVGALRGGFSKFTNARGVARKVLVACLLVSVFLLAVILLDLWST